MSYTQAEAISSDSGNAMAFCRYGNDLYCAARYHSTVAAYTLTQLDEWLKSVTGSSTGSFYAKVWKDTTGPKPDSGNVITSSNTKDVSTLGTSPVKCTFQFSPGLLINNGDYFWIGGYCATSSATNYLQLELGSYNASYYGDTSADGSSWSVAQTRLPWAVTYYTTGGGLSIPVAMNLYSQYRARRNPPRDGWQKRNGLYIPKDTGRLNLAA